MSVAPVAQDDIGRCTLAQRLEPSLDLVALVGGEKPSLNAARSMTALAAFARNCLADACASSARGPTAPSTAQCASRRMPRSIQPRIVAPAPISMSSE